MTERTQTIIILWGSSGTGKTALHLATQRGQQHLVDVPILREAMGTEFATLGRDAMLLLCEQDSAATLAAIRETIGDKRFLVSDAVPDAAWFISACSEHYRIVVIATFCYPWVVAARRDVRYRACPNSPEIERTRGVLPDESLVDYIAGTWLDNPAIEVVVADTSDYPIRTITLDEARAMVTSELTEPTLPAQDTMYQRSLRIGGKWHGEASTQRRQFEEGRVNAILPADLTGKTVLDIGASEGGMCYEALTRGAMYATGVELRPSHTALMQHIRTACQLPMTVCELDITQETLPPLTLHLVDVRYDLALLLNVLHHLGDNAEPVFRNVLRACDSLVLEGPFCCGKEPCYPAIEPYLNALHMPPFWIERIAAEEGFVLTSMANSPMTPGQRMKFKLQRKDSPA